MIEQIREVIGHNSKQKGESTLIELKMTSCGNSDILIMRLSLRSSLHLHFQHGVKSSNMPFAQLSKALLLLSNWLRLFYISSLSCLMIKMVSTPFRAVRMK